MKKLMKGLAILVVSAPFAASAEDANPLDYSWQESGLASKYGVSTTLGGGVTGFTNQTMRDTVSSPVGGLWDLKVTLGSHTPIGFDISYVGMAANINALIGTQSGTLVGTTAEGAVRYNILPHYFVNPYAFAGVGWQRYDITGNFQRSDTGMNESDNSIVFPMGAGVAYRDKTGLVLDVHGTFRANTQQGLVLESATSDNYAPMHTWQASGAIGYEF